MPINAENTNTFRIFPMGDTAVVVQFGEVISEEVYARVQAFGAYLEKHPFKGMIEYVPAFTTVTIFYDPWVLSDRGKNDPYEKIVDWIKDKSTLITAQTAASSSLVKIPVCYGSEFGPDLAFVARHNQLTTQEVIAIHSSVDYLVYMIGFAPGFPYLGGMDHTIAAPRKDSPGKAVPAGSAGIAGNQTGIYPIETPGGWQIIGRTPIPLFCPHKKTPVLLKAGDLVRFIPISADEYKERKEQLHEY